MIPKKIHQSWTNWGDKVDDPEYYPRHFAAWSETWKMYHPEWEYKRWNQDEERQLIKDDYSWFLPVYDGYMDVPNKEAPHYSSGNIKKCDAARYFYLHKYGGIYADVDFECLKPFDDIVTGFDFAVGMRGDDEDNPGCYQNSLMMCNPAAPFLDKVFELLIEKKDSPLVVDAAGPTLLWQAVRENPDLRKVFDWPYFYPLDWEAKNNRGHGDMLRLDAMKRGIVADHEEVKRKYPDAYAITYWTCSWMGQKHTYHY